MPAATHGWENAGEGGVRKEGVSGANLLAFVTLRSSPVCLCGNTCALFLLLTSTFHCISFMQILLTGAFSCSFSTTTTTTTAT